MSFLSLSLNLLIQSFIISYWFIFKAILSMVEISSKITVLIFPICILEGLINQHAGLLWKSLPTPLHTYTHIYIWTYIVRAKNLEATLFIDFSEALTSYTEGRWSKFLAYGLPKEAVTAIMMLYSNTKVNVRSPDGDRLLRYRCWSSARRYISTVSVYNLPKLRTSNISRTNK